MIHITKLFMSCFQEISLPYSRCSRNSKADHYDCSVSIFSNRIKIVNCRNSEIYKSEVGGCSTGKSFRFVRAFVRAVWLPSGIGSKLVWAGLFPFPFCLGQVVGLFLCWPGWFWGAFPFPFWAWELSLFPSPTPQTSYPTLVGLIGSHEAMQPHCYVTTQLLQYVAIWLCRCVDMSLKSTIGNH